VSLAYTPAILPVPIYYTAYPYFPSRGGHLSVKHVVPQSLDIKNRFGIEEASSVGCQLELVVF
jgi:hypothetical protein